MPTTEPHSARQRQNITDVIRDVLWPNLRSLRSFITTDNADEIAEALRATLRQIGGEGLPTHMVLLDEQGRVLLIIVNPSSASSSTATKMRDIEVKYLGYPLDSDSIYRLIPDQFGGQFFLGRRVSRTDAATRGLVDSPQFEYYDFWNLDIPLGRTAKTIKRHFWKRSVKVFIGLEVDGSVSVERWLTNVLVIGVKWTKIGVMPPMQGFIAISLKPDEDPFKQVTQMQNRLLLLSWFAGSAVLDVQIRVLSQASADQPLRLQEEFSSNGWIGILGAKADKCRLSRNARDSEDLKSSLTYLLGLRSEFVIKAVLREFGRYLRDYPALQPVVAELFHSLIGPMAESNSEAPSSALQHVKKAYPIAVGENPDLFWRSRLQSVQLSALMHLHTFFSSVECDLVDALVRDSVVPATISTYHHLCALDNDDAGAAIEFRKFCALLSTIEDALPHASQDAQHAAISALEALARGSYPSQMPGAVHRLMATLLLALHRAFSPDSAVLVQAITRLLLENERAGHSYPALVDKLLSRLTEDHAALVLKQLDANSVTFERIARITAEQNDIRNSQATSRPSLRPLEAISIVSSKGGVGKTSLALALSAHLALGASNPSKVCLVDLDFFGPTLNYFVGSRGLDDDAAYLNDYIWARYLPQLEKAAASNDIVARNRGSELRLQNKYMFERFEKFSASQDLVEQLLIDTAIPSLKIIASSRSPQLQDMMLPFIRSDGGLTFLTDELFGILLRLKRLGYGYVVFDTPAELKELALCASQLSTIYGGKNVFVTTLDRPSVEPILHLLSRGYYSNGNNYLVVSKARQLDFKYAKDSQAFMDYWATLNVADPDHDIEDFLSTTLLGDLMNIRACGLFPWNEYVHRLQVNRRRLSRDDYDEIDRRFSQHLGFLAR